MIESNGVSFLNEFLQWLLLNDGLLHDRFGPQESFVDLVGRDLALEGMVKHVLSCGIFLDCLDMSRNRNV